MASTSHNENDVSTKQSSTTSYTSSSTPTSSTENIIAPHKKPIIAIVGTGWAGWTLAQILGKSHSLLQNYEIVVLSPHRTMALTPLLASAACSLFDMRIAEEPVRRLSTQITKYQVHVENVNLENRTLRCRAAVGSNGDARSASEDGFVDAKEGGEEAGTFEVQYEKLILCPGSETNTFNTPGVLDHCLTMRSVSDARQLREQILDCFELATLPTFTSAQKRDILHFIIIGAGPTGVELAAEIDELVSQHLLHLYKDVAQYVTVSVYDVADKMLGTFGEKLSEYAMEKFKRRDVKICMGRHIERFERGKMHVQEDGEVGYGVAVWAAGNKACKLIEDIQGVRKEKGKVVTDRWLRVLRKPNEGEDGNETEGGKEEKVREEDIIPNIYALGDAADIKRYSLPATAEVAVQTAEWLAQHLISTTSSLPPSSHSFPSPSPSPSPLSTIPVPIPIHKTLPVHPKSHNRLPRPRRRRHLLQQRNTKLDRYFRMVGLEKWNRAVESELEETGADFVGVGDE